MLDAALEGKREASRNFARLAEETVDRDTSIFFSQVAVDEARHVALLEAQRAALTGGVGGESGAVSDATRDLFKESKLMLGEVLRRRLNTVSMVVHDLSQPITSVIGYVDILRDLPRESFTDEQSGLLDLIKSSVDRLVLMMEDIMLVARSETGHLDLNASSLDMKELVAEVAGKLGHYAAETAHSIVTDLHDVGEVVADGKMVAKVVSALIENSLKYSPRGTDVRLSLSAEGDGGVRVSVSDEGPAIVEGEEERLFEPFSIAAGERKTSGSGIGLALASRLVAAHGGVVRVDNNEGGKGVTFYFTLPRGPSLSKQAAPTTAADR